MFGWYVDIGVAKDQSINWSVPRLVTGRNISDFNIVDINRPYTILESSKIPDSGSGTEIYVNNGTNDAVYEKLSDLFGLDQLSAIYAVPGIYASNDQNTYEGKGGYKIYDRYIPSMTLSYPNVWQEYISMPDSDRSFTMLYTAIINRKNRRALIGYPGLVNAYSYDEDGVLSFSGNEEYSSITNMFNLGKIQQIYFNGQFPDGYGGGITIRLTSGNNKGWLERNGDPFSVNLIKYLFEGTPIAFNHVPELPSINPYEPGGSSETGGGEGSFDNTSTPINIPNLPTLSAASTGFISLFNPTLSELNDLASYLWSDLFEINGWKKLFADPMDAILGLSIVPVAVPSGGTREVKVGNIGTGKSLTIAASQFVEVDCGSIDVNEYWGAYLDYEPYTQAQIFLPYIGTRPISVDEIMGKTVRVVYHVDILTGACCCFVKCGDSVLYTYNGQCSIPIPITGANYASVVNGVISIAASVGSLVATGGSSAPTAIPAIASSAVNQMKPQVEKSGSISGSAGVLNMQTPYLILIRPRQALPSRQNGFIGYPSLITVQLTELKGYTEVQSIHLENIPATQEELAEIESLLKGGVIF